MTTIDSLLLKIINHPDNYAKNIMSKKDFDTLHSLAEAISSHIFITENQSKLLTKLLVIYKTKLPIFKDEIITAIESSSWSKPFRHIDQVKKLYLSNNPEGTQVLIVEFTFSATMRKVIHELGKKIMSLAQLPNSKKYSVDLTEKNIIILVDTLKLHEFEIEENVKNYYNTIKSWNEDEVKNQFLITSITNQNFHRHITADLGIDTAIDQNIINDRSLRYQYFPEKSKNFGENLTEIIANRTGTQIWIDKKLHNLNDIFMSLQKLRRLPILVIFDNWDETKNLEILEILDESLENCGLFDSVGIYFRMPNTDEGKKFNQFIAARKYNQKLDTNLKVAVVQGGKIPKFFLKNQWRPMSVIAIDTKMGLRHGKTAVYSNCCDLVIEHADAPSILEPRIAAWR
jgi:hypothetical protein